MSGLSVEPESSLAISRERRERPAIWPLRRADGRWLAAGLDATDLDLIIVATSTPDFIFPSTACLLQSKLGNHGATAFDVQAVCSGFVYG
jgi:hypothetical protein